MEFYDGDLKDIWDSDLDPESLKISSDHEMHDWFLDRDVKDPTVILNDKLISDALLNGTLPIKTEHSYSLNSDGDSLPNSPKSLQAKIEDMDDECYPVISLKTATSMRATIDPKCLTLHPPATNLSSATMLSHASASPALNTSVGSDLAALNRAGVVQTQHQHHHQNQQHQHQHQHQHQQQQQQQQHQHQQQQAHQAHLQHHGNSSCSASSSTSSSVEVSSALDHFHLPQHLDAMYDNDCSSSVSSAREGSISPDICSDIEIDESAIKDEPMSPDSSCPASPNSQISNGPQQQLSLNLPNLQTELLFEQHGGLLLATTSNNLIKSQHRGDLLMPKVEIKAEKQNASSRSNSFPLTPPSSLPSDDSEGNLSPEHLFSPLSPNSSGSVVAQPQQANGEPSSSQPSSLVRRATAGGTGITRSGSSGSGSSSTTTTTTRQPIHTPLISSQPKGSTGTLLLTEEEKRTLIAEGYPIPQKLPLTKAEEKSLKKIRRKIKNKISAQESRRKKKEYMDQLERRVEILVSENQDYKKRLESLEETNANLLSQLHKLQALVGKHNNVKKS